MRPLFFCLVLAIACGSPVATPTKPAAPPAPEAKIAPACRSPEARQFDFWIGEWTVENRHRSPRPGAGDTLHPTGAAVDRVYAILDGCAIVEHWQGHLVFADVFGFSVRAYDPDKGAWQLVGHWPMGKLGPLGYREGSFAGAVGDFIWQNRSRFRFKDIAADSLTWEGASSDDGGKTWAPNWVMRFARRDPKTDRAVFAGPDLTADTAPFCAGEELRRFDFVLGAWEGKTDDGQPVEVRGYRLNRGCTAMDFVTIGSGDEAHEWFRVRAYDPEKERWVQYAVSNRDPTFQRLEGTVADDSVELSGAQLRERWTGIGTGSLVWELASGSSRVRATLKRRGPI